MKNTKLCPKCSAKDIIRVEGYTGGHKSVEAGRNVIMTGLTLLSSIPVTRYVCGACGYTEEWIDDPEDLEYLKDRY